MWAQTHAVPSPAIIWLQDSRPYRRPMQVDTLWLCILCDYAYLQAVSLSRWVCIITMLTITLFILLTKYQFQLVLSTIHSFDASRTSVCASVSGQCRRRYRNSQWWCLYYLLCSVHLPVPQKYHRGFISRQRIPPMTNIFPHRGKFSRHCYVRTDGISFCCVYWPAYFRKCDYRQEVQRMSRLY